MDHRELEELITRYRNSPVPEAPKNLQENVWREIRLRQSASPSAAFDFDEFLGWFCRRMTFLAVPALALTLLISVSWTTLANQPASPPSVQRALGLDVFSHQSSALTRLIQ
jgi:hypothetical protein